MSSVIEVPDWTRPVSVMGKDSEGNPVTVLLDSLGRLICILYGAITLSGPVDVTQVDSTREIQGADGVTLHTIAVDSEGRIIAIVKGEYAGTLKNLAVDSEGRMIMIPTDPADVWGNAISMGNAELSARMGPVSSCDRLGNVMWFTSFEEGLHGSSFGVDHADSVGIISSSRSFRGAYSAKFDPRAAASSYVNWSRIIHFPALSKVGLEIALSLDPSPYRVAVAMYYYDGANYWEAQLLYDPALKGWFIVSPGPTWTEILSDFVLQTGANAWHPIKMVVDLTTKKYVRVKISRNEVDISAYDMIVYDSTALGQLEVRIQCQGSVAAHAAMYLDNVIVTQNEPA